MRHKPLFFSPAKKMPFTFFSSFGKEASGGVQEVSCRIRTPSHRSSRSHSEVLTFFSFAD